MRWLPHFLAFALCSTVVLVQSRYVGDLTIYGRELEAARIRLHEAILHNRAPAEGWAAVGANGLNVRVATVYLAEATSRIIGLPIPRTYKLIDMVSLLAALLCLERFLAAWAAPAARIAALLFVAAILPMTYEFHLFQPWDRIGWLFWVISLWALAQGHFGALATALGIAVTIKYDAIVLPALYAFVWYGRDDTRRVMLRTTALLVLCCGIYLGLRWLLPGGFAPRDPGFYASRNLSTLLSLNVNHPFVLGFGLPAVLAALGWRDGDQFARIAAVFALPMFGIFFVQTNFQEIRAQMGVLTLLLPLAVCGLRRVLSEVDRAPTRAEAEGTPRPRGRRS